MEKPMISDFKKTSIAKLALGVGLGSLIEYYDFFIAVFAATIVWPSVFFSWVHNPSLAYGLSLASFGILYFTRPIGAYLFGHFGDKIGRRSLILWTLSIMGVGVLGVGLVPGYNSIGIYSVLLLFVFRGLFGLGLGGEFGGAASWLVEASHKSRWRAFWAVWAAPSQIGYALASFTFALIASIYGKGLMTVGWRIPFLVGALLILIGIVIRYTLEESPLFQSLKQRNETQSSPARYAIKHGWRQILVLSGVLMFVLLPSGALQASYGIPYLLGFGIPSSFVTFSIGVAAALASVFLIIAPIASERFGRKRTMFATAVIAMIATAIYVPLLHTLNPNLIILAQFLLQATAASGLAISASVFAEYFPTLFRYSGSGLSFQFGGLYYGIIITFIEPVILARMGIIPSASYVVVTILVAMIIALACVAALKETRGSGMAP